VGLFHVEFAEGLGAEGGVGCYGYALFLGEFDEAFLGEVGVVFDLEGGGFYSGVAEEIHDELAVEVADADGASETVLLDFFHCLPGFLDGGVTCNDFFALVEEAGGVALFRVDVFEGDGEMDDVEVEVVDAPVVELLFADGFDVFLVVVGVPEFGDEKEIFSLHYTFLDGAGDTLACFDFIAVVACTIEESIARLDGIVNLIGTGVIVNFP